MLPNTHYFQYCVEQGELRQTLTKQRLPVIGGDISVPEGPGLGIYHLDAVGAVTGSAGNLEKGLASLEALSIPTGNNSGVVNVFLGQFVLIESVAANPAGAA